MEIDLPDEPAPHPQNEPTATTSGNPQNNTNINLEITEFPLKSAGAPIIDGTRQQTHYRAISQSILLQNGLGDCVVGQKSMVLHPRLLASCWQLTVCVLLAYSLHYSYLLPIVRQLSKKLNLSYKNAWELNNIATFPTPISILQH